MGIDVFDTHFLSEVLRRDAFSSQSRHDFGGDILPSVIRDARVFAHPFGDCDGNRPAYWRDVGTPTAYWRAHLELLDSSPSLRLDDAHWPLPAARGVPKLTARHARSGHEGGYERSLVADDCVVGGTVRRSVLFSGVQVSEGALVENAVILSGTVIDHAWRARASYEPAEPVIVTAEDLSPELVSLCA
jgi:glucose-1-phosphate adenylyltransferase